LMIERKIESWRTGEAIDLTREWRPWRELPDDLKMAVIAAEDQKFADHWGFDVAAIRAALSHNERGGSLRGASTLSQQVAKNLFLGPEKTLRRKLREAILARRLERVLTKDEILTVYLNVAEWGEGIAGAEAAARRYFGKSAADLNWSEAALLAGILPNPRKWNPCRNPARARQARHAVLIELLATRQLQPGEFLAADSAPIGHCTDD